MRIAIIGSREFSDFSLMASTVDKFIEKSNINVEKIVSGGARGTDTLAAHYASQRGYLLQEFKPDYSRYGRGAPLMRNSLIVENADIILAFVRPNSKGSWDTIGKAQGLHKIVKIVNA